MEKEYGIKTNPVLPGNPQTNSTIYRIHQVIGNLARIYNLHETCVHDADPWMEILSEDDFAVRYTYNRTKGKSSIELVFGQFMTLPINHIDDWK